MGRNCSIFSVLVFTLFCSGKQKTAVIGTDPDYGYIDVSRGILRSDPVAIAPELELLTYGERVAILGHTAKKVRISSMNDYWYRIRLENRMEGWVYGAALTFDRTDMDQKRLGANRVDPKELEAELPGQWWQLKEDGSTGLFKYSFWPDGICKFGFGNTPMKECKYEITEEGVTFEARTSAGIVLTPLRSGKEIRLKGSRSGKDLIFFKGSSELDPLNGAQEQQNQTDGGESNHETEKSGKPQ